MDLISVAGGTQDCCVQDAEVSYTLQAQRCLWVCSSAGIYARKDLTAQD